MNALVILLVVVISLIGISATLLSGAFRSSQRTQKVTPDLAPQEPGKPELRLGQFSRVGNSNVLRAELREQGEGSFSIKGSRSIAHNVLFLDTNDGRSWWLLPDSNSVISEDHEISITQNGKEVPLGKIYLIDPDNHEQEKETSILLADAKGVKQVILAKGGLLIDELTTFSNDDARLLYHDQSGYHLAVINPAETRLVKDSKVAIAFPPRK